ncbi:autoinducer binding domain-containing protein [Pseudomonas sp. MH2]|uniref:Autoinducer binding domain-containing protein n=1 Tax=Pseudomonas machongensis TaxID=3110229 RepID=A0ABU5VJD5_9PSED|nr:autoinducer binding domain-containing protein [Pseudomonas sp. MH2]MEA5673494.1 autoinducer binding domain-containing protein [Pseudomonas sp. MH2]
MDRKSVARWQQLQGLTALLDELPRELCRLGFNSYSFAFSVRAHRLHSSNIDPGPITQEALAEVMQPALSHSVNSNSPLLWTASLFADKSRLWDRAQTYGLRHGWVQPQHSIDAHSHLAIFRPYVVVSSAEMYRKAMWVMWLSERLHQAATQLLSKTTDPGNPSHPEMHPCGKYQVR